MHRATEVTVVIITYIFSVVQAGYDWPAVCPEVISKDEWGARGAVQIEYAVAPLNYVIIHHTVTPTCNSKLECSELLVNMQDFHIEELGFDDIGYNFMIGGDGKVYVGRGWHMVGAHTRGYNSRSVGIAFIGTFTDKLPNQKQLQAAKDLIECGAELKELDTNYKIYGARQVSATQSPGIKLYNEIQKWSHYSKRV